MFILISVVVVNLLGLFESSCGTIKGCSTFEGESRGFANLPSKNTPHTSRSTNLSEAPLPFSSGPLMIGDIVLEESIKVGFSRRLMRVYAERQLKVVQYLNISINW